MVLASKQRIVVKTIGGGIKLLYGVSSVAANSEIDKAALCITWFINVGRRECRSLIRCALLIFQKGPQGPLAGPHIKLVMNVRPMTARTRLM